MIKNQKKERDFFLHKSTVRWSRNGIHSLLSRADAIEGALI